jgi:hypothetical protein
MLSGARCMVRQGCSHAGPLVLSLTMVQRHGFDHPRLKHAVPHQLCQHHTGLAVMLANNALTRGYAVFCTKRRRYS